MLMLSATPIFIVTVSKRCEQMQALAATHLISRPSPSTVWKDCKPWFDRACAAAETRAEIADWVRQEIVRVCNSAEAMSMKTTALTFRERDKGEEVQEVPTMRMVGYGGRGPAGKQGNRKPY